MCRKRRTVLDKVLFPYYSMTTFSCPVPFLRVMQKCGMEYEGTMYDDDGLGNWEHRDRCVITAQTESRSAYLLSHEGTILAKKKIMRPQGMNERKSEKAQLIREEEQR